MKNYKFAITDSTTYYGQDALEFYSKALLEGATIKTFSVIPGVKSTIKLPSYNAGNIVKTPGTSWSATGEGTLAQKTFEVCSKDIQLELFTTTFEANFLGELLKAGHNTGEVTPQMFLDYVLDEVAKKVQNDVEIAIWQGTTGATVYPYTICEGLGAKLDADSAVIKSIGATAFGATACIPEIQKVYNNIPATIINDPDLKIWVSTPIWKGYQQAIAEASNEAYYVGAKEPNFLGIPLIQAPGMANGTMLAASSKNMIFLTDLIEDLADLRIIPQANISGVRSVRIAGGFKMAPGYKVSEEVVWYKGTLS